MRLYVELDGPEIEELGDILLALRTKYPKSVMFQEDDNLVIELRKGEKPQGYMPNTVHPYPINDPGGLTIKYASTDAGQ